MPEQQPGDLSPAGPPGSAVPPQRSGSDDEPDTAPIPVDEPATEQVRWRGAAPVPGAPHRGGGEQRRGSGEQRLDPTLDLPIEERDGAPPPAVDPWADAAPPWGHLPPALPAPPQAPPALPAQPPALPGPPPPAPPAGPGPHPPPGPHLPGPHHPDHRPPGRPAAWWRPALPPAPPPAVPAQRGAPPPAPPPVVPPGYELRRRRRRWPRRLTLLLLTVGCCCACPAYYLTPVWQQYPASAAVPAKAANMTKRDDRAADRTVRELEAKARARNWLAEDTFAAVYDGGPGWQVTVYGTTGFRLSPESDLEAEIAQLREEFRLDGVREVDPGSLGGHQRCGVGTAPADDPDLVLCAWADHGSLGVATFSAGSVDESAETLRVLREAIVTRE